MNNFQEMMIFFKTIPKALNLTLILSVFVLLLKVFIFNSFEEPFRGMKEIGLVFEGVLASIIASYVFYLIIVHYKEISDKRTVYTHIAKWVKQIVTDCKSDLSNYSQQTKVTLNFETLLISDVQNAFKKIGPYQDAPAVFIQGSKANWIQYMFNSNIRCKTNITKLLSQLIYLDAELVGLLSKINESQHIKVIDLFINAKLSNETLENFAKDYFEFCIMCRELQNYLSENILMDNLG